MSPLSPTVQMDAPAALRALARAFSHLGEFDRFVAGLQTALDRSALFEKTTIAIDRGIAGAVAFPAGRMSLPLASADERHGLLQAAPPADRRQFGAEDLHLLAGLADFLSAALGASVRLQGAEKSRELLRFLLNQSPVGIAAYGADHRLIVANDLAIRWIGQTTLPFAEMEKGEAGFHLRAGGKLIYGEARRSGDAAGDWLVVLHDLTAEQVRLLELVKRDTYRALAEGGRMGIALVESAQLHDGVLRRLPELRSVLLVGEAAGPYDAHRIGLVLNDVGGLALRARLRRLRGAFGEAAGLRLGYAEVGPDGRTPENLLRAALQRYGAYDDLLRPAVLVHDENPGVADTLAMVLSKDFRVVKSSASDRTRELLRTEPFEGLVAELDSRTGLGGLELAKLARELQPGIRPFLTTINPGAPGLPTGEAVVIGKPFQVAELTRTVKAQLAN